MAVKFIVDSASDILPKEAEELGIKHIPLKVLFGEEEFADAVDMTHREFYERLVASDVLPTTSQITPAEFADAYEEIVAAGDTAVVVTLSSKLSGTYQSAVIAAEDYPGKVFVVDSENVCVGERILVLRGLELLKQGLTAEEIAARLDEEKKSIRLLAVLDTLEYLKKGGRISAAVALAGGLLSIKPLIKVEDGEVAMAGKARGAKQAASQLKGMTEGYGIAYEKPMCLAYSGLTDEPTKKFVEDYPELWQGHENEIPITTVGCVIGTHAGPGAVAIAFFDK